ncbi:hypothetical protein [Thermosulfurimonas dismutans]|uniref:Uncharacterized protein n=1 Tax=Thermosulfurimonas dismutans TaxID=999894 RepID=A0A179D740_9BACT|nr:hypothetical protein [Thermosulfurimonas dismutans]OAQ21857.1 hypothetical protein TDIS_0375 [Thermosulfurimonas dismutans]
MIEAHYVLSEAYHELERLPAAMEGIAEALNMLSRYASLEQALFTGHAKNRMCFHKFPRKRWRIRIYLTSR